MTEHKQIFFTEDVGKPVTSLIHGKGKIIDYRKDEMYPVEVSFNNGDVDDVTYLNSGYEYKYDINRELYHGHNIQINGEEIPVRKKKKWLNVWIDNYGASLSCLFTSKESALKFIYPKTIVKAMEVEIETE